MAAFPPAADANVLLQHLPVQGTPPRLVLVRLPHQESNGVQAGRVLLFVVIARQVQPGEHLLPLVDGTVEVLHGSLQPVCLLAGASALAFVDCPGIVPQSFGLPGKAVEGGASRQQGRHRDRFLSKGCPLPNRFIEGDPQRAQGEYRRKGRRERMLFLLWEFWG